MIAFINTGSVLSLLFAAVVLGVLAVLLDRVNFPQRPFRAKQIQPSSEGPIRDRTGAHIVDVTEVE